MLWKEIKGFEGYYEVSDSGAVRSVDRVIRDKKLGQKRLKGRELTLSKTRDRDGSANGYLVVNLRKNGVANVRFVHRLVAEAFIQNLRGLPTINHKNGNKQDNRASNLEWSTYAENNMHALVTKLRHPRGTCVAQMSADGTVVCTFRSVCEAARRTGIGRSIISHCVNHRVSMAGGYRWEKIEKCNDYLINESTTGDELPSEAQERGYPEDIVCTDRNI